MRYIARDFHSSSVLLPRLQPESGGDIGNASDRQNRPSGRHHRSHSYQAGACYAANIEGSITQHVG